MTAPNRVVLLGVKGGPSLRAGGSMPTASLVDLDGHRIVVDCGLGVSKALVEAGVDLTTLSAIFVTQLHSDHILELGGLIHTAWCSGLKTPVRVYGPEGIEGYWQGFLAAVAYDNHLRVVDDGRVPLTDLVSVTTITEGPVAFDGLSVAALRVKHPPVDHALALRFSGSRTVTFSGDTTYFPPLAAFGAGSDLLVHEAMLPEAIEAILQKTGGGEKLRAHLHASHTTADDAARIAALAGVGRLALNHLVPVDDPRFGPDAWRARAAAHWTGPFILGHDGLEILL